MADSQKCIDTINILPSAPAETKSESGITVACDGQGIYTITGNNSTQNDIYVSFLLEKEITIPISVGQGGQGTFSMFNNVSSDKVILQLYDDQTTVDTWILTPANRNNSVYSAMGSKQLNKIGFRIMANSGALSIVCSPMFTNDGQLPTSFIPHKTWQHSLRKLTTATEAVENPLYSDGSPITAYTIKGNTVQSGTPSPSNPVTPNGVGERTENYFNVQNYVANITTHSCTVSAAANGVKITATGSDAYAGEAYKSPDVANFRDSQAAIPVEENTSYVLSADVDTFTDCYISYLNSSYKALNANYTKIGADVPATFTTPTGTAYIALRLGSKSLGAGQSKTFANITLTKNGLYKIPISSGQQTTNIYLGSTQTVRQIKKLVLTGNEEGWDAFSSGDNLMFRITLNDTMTNSAILSTHFENKGIYSTNTVVGAFIDGSIFKCRPENVSSMTVNDWKYYLQQQYANGTPVTVWYVLATPETTTVNEPLMKIGTYADTLSNAVSIPTTEGANSITVDTTVQPSEFTATWTGWHNASVKEKSENLFDGTLITGYYNGNINTIDPSQNYRSFRIQGLPAGQYTVSWNIPVKLVRAYYDGVLYGDVGDGLTSYTVTSTDGDIAFSFRDNTSSATPWSDSNTVMLNTGSTALPYEPYWQ